MEIRKNLERKNKNVKEIKRQKKREKMTIKL